jgi:hypothetical protein
MTDEQIMAAAREMIRANWSDSFFGAIEMDAGSLDYVVDERPARRKSRKAPVLNKDAAFIPADVIAQTPDAVAGKLPTGDYISPAQAEALGLDVGVDAKSGRITITAPYQTKRLLVKTDGRALPGNYGAKAVLPLQNNVTALQFASAQAAKNACGKLSSEPWVEYCAPDAVESASAQHLSWGVGRMRADEYLGYLERLGPSGQEVLVAVIDSGLDVAHPLFAGRVSSKRISFVGGEAGNIADGYSHGTHVAGTIVDATPANVKIMPVKSMDDRGVGTAMSFVQGLNWAVSNGADVVNHSGGSRNAGEALTAYYRDAIAAATRNNVVVVIAAGNDGVDVATHAPANLDEVITVTACREGDEFAEFSNRGKYVDICAPGVGIYGATPNGGYGLKHGTSAAAPFVAAAAALLKTRNKAYTPDQIKAMLRGAADDRGPTGWDEKYGAGVLNLERLIEPDAPTGPAEPPKPPKTEPPRLTAGAMGAAEPLTSSLQRELAAGAKDCYAFTAPADGLYSFYTTGSLDTYGEMYDASGAWLESNDDADNNGYNFRIDRALAAGARYYLRVRGFSARTAGPYGLQVLRLGAPDSTSWHARFDANGGLGIMPTRSFTRGVAEALPANAFSKKGYAFKGWALTPRGPAAYADGQTVRDLSVVPGGVVYLYAVWG